MPRVPIASEDERKFIVDGIQVRVFLNQNLMELHVLRKSYPFSEALD